MRIGDLATPKSGSLGVPELGNGAGVRGQGQTQRNGAEVGSINGSWREWVPGDGQRTVAHSFLVGLTGRMRMPLDKMGSWGGKLI